MTFASGLKRATRNPSRRIGAITLIKKLGLRPTKPSRSRHQKPRELTKYIVLVMKKEVITQERENTKVVVILPRLPESGLSRKAAI